MKGRIKWFHPVKGFGFIEAEDGSEIFLHYSAFVDIPPQENLEALEVLFRTEKNTAGLRAIEVKILPPGENDEVVSP